MPWYFYGKTGTLVTPKPPSILAPGTIVMSPLPYSATPPAGYLFCNGQSVLKNDHLVSFDGTGPGLFFEIGTAFGTININEFSLPDLRSRFPRGIVSLAQGVGSTFGVGGSPTHSHTLPAHDHSISDNHSHTMPAHTHTFLNHTHGLGNHTHGAGGLTVGASNDRGVDNTDTVEPPGSAPSVDAIQEPIPGPAHNHGGNVGGVTGAIDSGNVGAASTANGNGEGGGITNTNSLDAFNLVGVSTGAGPYVSSLDSNQPPYFTCSFLIKT